MLDSFLGIYSQTETSSKPQHVRLPFRWYLAARCSQVWDLCVWSCSHADTGYQILEQKTVVKLNDKALEDTSEWRGLTEKKKIKHWTYQHRWVVKAPHSLSNRSSFQVCSAPGRQTNVILSQISHRTETWLDLMHFCYWNWKSALYKMKNWNQIRHISSSPFFWPIKPQKCASQPTMQPSKSDKVTKIL